MNAFAVLVAKRDQTEQFDPLKLHDSVIAACFAVRAYEGEAHATAQRVCERVIEWLGTKTEVTANDIRRVTGRFLNTYHPDAAYVYQNFNTVI